MAETTIEWTRSPDGSPGFTFNPWTGCLKVSPACDHCYAEALAKRSPRTFGSWLPGAPRKRTSEAYWKQPLAWNRKAEAAGKRLRVFCASMADVFDNQVPEDWRHDLFDLIQHTEHLDWLLLTKRPQNIARMIPQPSTGWSNPDWPWPNVWLGTTVENQAEADRRIPHLLGVPAVVRFLSCEPLLGPVDLTSVQLKASDAPERGKPPVTMNALRGWYGGAGDPARIGWVIAGGESGPGARPSHPDWFRSLRDQCAAAGVPFHFKQWGEWGPLDPQRRAEPHAIADDGTLYHQRDLAHPDGARRGEAIRANHDRAHLTSIYRIGKKAAGALLDGREHREAPGG